MPDGASRNSSGPFIPNPTTGASDMVDDSDIFEVKFAGPEGVQRCKIEVEYTHPSTPMFMAFSARGMERVVFQGADLFECIKGVRRHLGGMSMLLLCNGARIDAYPSGMSRQMGRARKVCIVELGKPGTQEGVVDIFGAAPFDKVGSVEAQREFHDNWLRSLGWVIIKCKLNFAGPQGVAPCTIDIVGSQSSTRLSMMMRADGMESIESQGDDLFNCLKAVRLVLEGRAIVLLCNGARIDSYPTQADRQADYGRNIHITEFGKPTAEEFSVDIFADAPIDKVGSVAAQQAYHEEWLRSLGSDT